MLSILFGPEKERILLNASLTVQGAILLLVRHSMNPKATMQDISGLSLFDSRLSSSALPLDDTLQKCGILSNDTLDGAFRSRLSS